MRSVTITLLAKDGFSKVIDVSEEILRHGVFKVPVRIEVPVLSPVGSVVGVQLNSRIFEQDREHMTLFKER